MWTRNGTVNVTANSPNIVGVGTDWLVSARVGEAFVSHTGSFHEIIAVASNTSMTVSPAYTGTTATGRTYMIVPVRGYTKELATQAAMLIQDYANGLAAINGAAQKAQNLADLANAATARLNLGLGSAALKAEADFLAAAVLDTLLTKADNLASLQNRATARTNLGLGSAALKAEADFLAASVLSTLLTKADNLAGVANAATARLNLGVVSAVGQEVYNSGNCTITTNSNGVAFRFPFGLQVCWRHVATVAYIINAGATGVISAANWTFPAVFNATPAVVPVFTGGFAGARVYGYEAVNSTAASSLAAGNWSGSNISSNMSLQTLAVGTWK